jgi:hypothetical protein
MATPQLSPGVLVREVDLTVGRVDNVLDNVGAIAGPFELGPVDQVIEVTNENDLLKTFGKPISTDSQNKYWLSASSFLSYSGIIKVVRVDDPDLKNANAAVGYANTTNLKIKNYENYVDTYQDSEPGFCFASQTPGRWANDMVVSIIDDKSDQILTISSGSVSTLGIEIGNHIISKRSTSYASDSGEQLFFNGHLKSIVTGITTNGTQTEVGVKILSTVVGYTTSYNLTNTQIITLDVGISSTRVYVDSVPVGLSTSLNIISIPSANLIDIPITGIGSDYIDINVGPASTINSGDSIQIKTKSYSGGVETKVTYKELDDLTSFTSENFDVVAINGSIESESNSILSVKDWYRNQKIILDNQEIYWSNIAPKPVSTNYALERGCVGDSMHIAVFDNSGKISGIKSNLLEKHLFLSKASDAESTQNAPLKIWWKEYLSRYSTLVYGGRDLSRQPDLFWNITPSAINSTGFIPISDDWNQDAQNKSFTCIGSVNFKLKGGENYNQSGGYAAGLDSIISGYRKFENKDEISLDHLIMGPSLNTKVETQAKAKYLISIAESRKDCIATISPFSNDVINITSSETQTNNIISFYSSLPSSSYAVFDSGYKYTYDRFNSQFTYVPCNPDVAGLMVRTGINFYPWFSPAGQQRGIINNAVKLAYNPSKVQRDRLYSQRINPIITQSGVGTLLFGDKTGLSYPSAFDRINVRRLFLTVEQAIESAAKAQLFELNDEITRSNFINIVEPYLREVKSKRGVYDYLLVCDSSNNTPDIIDNNEFRADIYLKPTKSINYVTLTFVATRTGISFEEVAGTV